MVNKYTFDSEGDVCCEHGKARLLTSKSPTNPNRKYYKCRDYRDGCLFQWQDELQGSPQKPVQQSQPQTPAKRPRTDDEPLTDGKRRRLEAIQAAISGSPVASGSSQPIASGSQPRPSQAQRLADQRSQSQTQSQTQSQSHSQDSQGGFVMQEAQHPSQDECQEHEDTGDGLFSQGPSPLTPPPSQQRYRLSDNHINSVKHEEPDSPSPLRVPGDLDVDEILSPVKSRITTLERKQRSLEQSNEAKAKHIERLKQEMADLQRANAALKEENVTLKVDLEREKKNVNIFQDLLSRKSD
ncbi:hypothetical protein BDZ89DRAFT_1165965 [Hymenopellis radicata]|nr:hypothetical protein BDZ89DRAFT_1165965 [Hymenopellis radicata]